MEPKEATVKELMDYLWLVAGPIHPGVHNVYFNSPDLKPNPLEDPLGFQWQQQDIFLQKNPVNAIKALLLDQSGLDDFMKWNLIELVDTIKYNDCYPLEFEPYIFEFNCFDELKLDVLNLIDKDGFKKKIFEILNQHRNEDELVGILQLIEEHDKAFVREVILKIKNELTLKITSKVLERFEFLKRIKDLDLDF